VINLVIDKTIEVFKEIVSKRTNRDKDAIKPYEYQLKVFRGFERLANGDLNVLIIRAPPARGKTEASTAPFLAQFVSGNIILPRIVYATPTQTLLYSMVRRFEEYLKAVSSAYGSFAKWMEKLSPVAEHGLDIDPQYLIPRFTVSTYDVVAYAWTARRSIPWRPFTTRGAMLSSLMVFDEAHLVQDSYTYSQRVFTKLVETMARSGIPIIIMSATLPNTFVDKIKNSLGMDCVEEIVDSDVAIPGKLSVFPIGNDAKDFIKTMAEVVDVVKGATEKCKDVLLVFNTVKIAVEAYNILLAELKKEPYTVVEVGGEDDVVKALKSGKDKIVLLVLIHGRLPIAVRRRREELFEKLRKIRSEMLQHGLEKRWSLIVVATQVAEVGLDYSFDYVVTELAPPSALVQRIMRAGRIMEQESKALILPPIILECRSSGKCISPSYFVYTKDMLELGKNFVDELSKDCTKIADINYVANWIDKEFEILNSRAKEWVKKLVNQTYKTLDTIRSIPPLTTAVHLRNILEKFRFRLGEYVALYIIDGEIPEFTDIKEFKKKLSEMVGTSGEKIYEVIDRSIKYTLRFRKTKGNDHLTVTVPSECIWTVDTNHILPYIWSYGKDVEINVLKLKKLDKNGKVFGVHNIENIYGKILICRCIPNFKPEIGIVGVEEVDLVVY